MIRSYTCLIHRPDSSAPNFLAVSCLSPERALVHAERAAAEWDDWRRIEVFLGMQQVAVRERDEA